ncbi:MAG TPA: hemerythrin domain-containing protein [Candidatus Polarisedimenticolia bacterium]|nr:hemerythrin domain-containing protein [Candidatus Polarisedimenticolia bacterium]
MTGQTQTDSAMEYLSADHRRLDGLMGSCKAMAEAGDLKGAGRVFAEFRLGLMRHIKIEEGLLFPEFETASGLSREGGPTGVMRHEHAEIIRLLGLVQDLFDLERPAADEFERLRASLVALLHEHNMKEERILYPMTDRMVSPPQLKELCRQMREFK